MPASPIYNVKTNNLLLEDILDIRKDIVISGEFSFFGSSTTGGEGFCVYFVNACTGNDIGSPGPGLGFAPTDGIVEFNGNDIFSGVPNSILGIGFDAAGAFALPLSPDIDGDTVYHPNAITLRHGSLNDWQYIASSDDVSDLGFSLYQTYGDLYPKATATATTTPTFTPSKTFTATANSTATATPTLTRTSTVTSTPTRTTTRTTTQSTTVTSSLNNCVTPTKTPTRTHTPTLTYTNTVSITKSPTSTGLYPRRQAFKIRLSDYGRTAYVYLRNNAGNFVLVHEEEHLDLIKPENGQIQIGLSYSTGVNYSAFHIYNFSVNGVGYDSPFTPTPTATKNITRTSSPTPTPTYTLTYTPTQNHSPTPTATNTPTLTNTVTITNTNFATPTITRTQTPTQSRTATNTRTSTQFPTRTQTPTNTRTASQTPTRTSTQTRTSTTSRTPTQTHTHTPTEFNRFIAASNSTYKFVFESKWVNADSAAAAVNVMINNARFGINRNTGSTNLINLITTSNPNGVANDFDRQYFRAFFFDGTAITGQQQYAPGVDGQTTWLGIPFVENKSSTSNPNTDFRDGVSSNVYQALKILVNTGDALDDTLIYINKTDNSNERPNPAQNSGENFNIWGIDGLTSDYKTVTFDASNNDRYVINYNNTGRILYNYDYIENDSDRPNFIATPDSYRVLPNIRYLRVISGDVDVSFSYATELINYIDSSNNNSTSYWGARLTLFTNVRQ